MEFMGFSWWLRGKESTCNAGAEGDAGSIPGSGRSPGGGHGNHSSILSWRILVETGAWWATVHGVAKSRTRLKGVSSSSNRIYISSLRAEFQPCLTLNPSP